MLKWIFQKTRGDQQGEWVLTKILEHLYSLLWTDSNDKYIEYRLSLYTIVGPCVALKSANFFSRLSCIEIRVFVADIGNSSEADFLALKAILVGVFRSNVLESLLGFEVLKIPTQLFQSCLYVSTQVFLNFDPYT